MSQTNSAHLLFLVFLGMLILVLLLISVVFFYSFLQYKNSVRTSGWLSVINKKISEAIVYDEEVPSSKDFDTLSANPSFRNLFLHRLVDSENKFSGAAKNTIKNLFRQYNLQKEAVRKLNRKKPYLIAGGIRELTVMNADETLPKIAALVSHPSPQVYQEAQYAMVKFRGFEGLTFLDSASEKISEWQQLRLLLSITSIPENSAKTIENWLESSNASVIIFTLKLLRKFQLLSFYPTVISLMNHPSFEVRTEAVDTLLSLENSSTIKYLTEVYPDQPVEVQLEILRAMKISKDPCCTDLLKNELMQNTDTGIRANAAEALFSLGYKEYLEQISRDKTSSDELVQIVKYALQEKVC